MIYMNDKLHDKVIAFFNLVSYYIYEEYPSYYKKFHNEKTLIHMFNVVQGYYLGGNNVSDTANYIINDLKGKNNG